MAETIEQGIRLRRPASLLFILIDRKAFATVLLSDLIHIFPANLHLIPLGKPGTLSPHAGSQQALICLGGIHPVYQITVLAEIHLCLGKLLRLPRRLDVKLEIDALGGLNLDVQNIRLNSLCRLLNTTATCISRFPSFFPVRT